MRICGTRLFGGAALLLATSLVIPAIGHAQTAAYLDHAGLTRELNSLVNGSNLATMESLGTTLGGREVWLVTVANTSGTPLDERPGVLVVGNLEGDHLVGSQLSLEAIRYLLQNAQDEAVQSALSDHVFYFFPRLNPDGAEAMFARVKWNRKSNGQPFDDDNDRLTDEDGPEDLNGDGYISVMRVVDPSGAYMIDPDDNRLMKRADATKGERGGYKLYGEGTDEDGDGFINEDGPGGVDLNRNFQHAYPQWQADAGPHMVSEVETRALMDFTIAHRNIATILTFGETDNLVTPPDSRGGLAAAKILELPAFAAASNDEVFDVGIVTAGGGGGGRGGGRGGGGGGGVYLRGAQPGRDNDPTSGVRPATTVASPDQVYFTAVSDAYKRITGIENVPMHRTPEGAFFQYGYFQFGVPSFSTLGWGLPADTTRGRSGPLTQAGGSSGTDKEILSALDAANIDAFSDWTPFQHPELGNVEIGGFLPYLTHNPPAEQLPELGKKHGEFLVELAGMLPKVRIADTKVTAHGGGVFTVTVDVENAGFLPTSLRHGQTSRSVGATFLQIQIDDDDILSGAEKTTDVGTLNGSGTRGESVTWVIRGREGAQLEIKLYSQKSGRDTATVTLR
ncbi:MAG: M14 family metallopeptidase [Longimicrobiales bacterium]|nr:M14 family metallopeptidase [Longimicrobiales bacterium]